MIFHAHNFGHCETQLRTLNVLDFFVSTLYEPRQSSRIVVVTLVIVTAASNALLFAIELCCVIMM